MHAFLSKTLFSQINIRDNNDVICSCTLQEPVYCCRRGLVFCFFSRSSVILQVSLPCSDHCCNQLDPCRVWHACFCARAENVELSQRGTDCLVSMTPLTETVKSPQCAIQLRKENWVFLLFLSVHPENRSKSGVCESTAKALQVGGVFLSQKLQWKAAQCDTWLLW